jgi:hypothetical protein
MSIGGWPASNTVDLYLGTAQFECWLGHQQSLQAFHGFPQSILENARMVPPFYHFLPDPS